jgi:hypothetical protein
MVKYAFVKNHVEENDNILKKEEENNIKIVLDQQSQSDPGSL